MQDFWSVGAKREVVQGKNLADAAKRSGVEHFVYGSVGGAERNFGIDHWESKREIEKYIHKLNLPATMLRPAAFMENYYIDQVEIGILRGKFMDPIRADKPYQTIATDDIGAFAALAFERPREFIGLELEIAGSELTNLEAAQVFGRVLGRRVKFQKLPMTMVRFVPGKEFYQMFRWFNSAAISRDPTSNAGTMALQRGLAQTRPPRSPAQGLSITREEEERVFKVEFSMIRVPMPCLAASATLSSRDRYSG